MVNLTTLDNGVRIITEHVPHVESVAIGVWIGAGAKHERPEEHGLCHVLEHMLFKGTERRSARDIADEIASVGGQINAATDREYTTYYAKVLKESTPTAIDILTDMIMHASFAPEELTREKDVISDEIRRHEDLPEEKVHDVLAETAWGDHVLGHGVLGSEETVRSATRETLVAFRIARYRPGRIVVSAAGNLDSERIVEQVDSTLGSLNGRDDTPVFGPVTHRAGQRTVSKKTETVYFCIGAPGYSELDERRYKLAVMDAVLGGGMSSRLFQEIREKRGLAYDVGSYRVSYHEGGLFAVYGGASPGTFREVIDLVREQLNRVQHENVPADEFERAQSQIRAALLFAQESMGSRMSRMGKSLLDHGRMVTVGEVQDRIQAVTPDDLREIAGELLDEERLSMAVIGPGAQVRKALRN